uniref:Uncharacterized protein n=1 Tax=Sphaerodactylus townsendi TaxID=933632 RepID=A0ACB8E8S5_9SAUR
MDPALYVLAAALLAALIVFVSRVRGQARAADDEHQQNVATLAVGRPQPHAPERGEGMPRRRRNMRSRLLAQRGFQQAEDDAEGLALMAFNLPIALQSQHAWDDAREKTEAQDDGGVWPSNCLTVSETVRFSLCPYADDNDGAEAGEPQVSGKIGAKKQRKLEEKQARKAQREADEAEREERKKLEQKREEERRKEEERLRQEEEQKEEEEKKAKEEEEKREHEEYLKLKESFVVEEEGLDEAMSEEESRSFLTELLNYIKGFVASIVAMSF